MSAPTPFLLRTSGWSGRAVSAALGAVAVLGQAPLHWWPLTLISLAILFGRLQFAAETPRPGKAGLSAGFWWALGYFAAGTFWVGSAFIERGPAFIPLMPFMVAGLACLLAAFWGLAGGLFARARLSGWQAVLGFTAIFLLAELVRGHALGGFPWNLPAYIFEAGSRPSQSARWFGAYGLSAVVLFISAALGQLLFWRRSALGVIAALLPLIALYGVGHWRLVNAQTDYVDTVRLRLVSVPFKQSEKMDPSTSIDITNAFIRASLAPGLKDVTHLVWPEGAVNGIVVENEALLRAVGDSLVSADDTPPVWLMNSLLTEMEQGRRRYYNASVAVTFDALGNPAVAASNRKTKLVPFGEHIPFMDWMEDVQLPLISTNLASISPGDEKRLAAFPGLPRLSPQLCYEIIFPGFTPDDAAAPAQFILNQSNDAWFGQTVGPAQHANIARYRAIETGLPIVRAASNGVTAVTDGYGRILSEINISETSHIDTNLPKSIGFNAKIGRVNLWLALISVLGWGIVSLMRKRAPTHRKS